MLYSSSCFNTGFSPPRAGFFFSGVRMLVNQATVDLVKRSEGCRLTAYLCPAGVPTIGYGHTAGVTADDVQRKRRISQAVADAMLLSDLEQVAQDVVSACKVVPNGNQLGAMVCLAYNIGLEAFRGSSILKAHNRNDLESAARAFGLWNKANIGGKKVVVAGLVARRAAEAALYLNPPLDNLHAIPQLVETEKPIGTSNIIRGGAVTAGASALGLASEVAQQIAGIRSALGDWLPYAVMAVALGAAIWIIVERVNHRREGNA